MRETGRCAHPRPKRIICQLLTYHSFRSRSQQTQTRLQPKQFRRLDFIVPLQRLIRISASGRSQQVQRILARRDRFQAFDAAGGEQPLPHNPRKQRKNPGAAKAGETVRESKWRRRRDSNPRYRFRYTPLAGERLRPLGHVSADPFIGTGGAGQGWNFHFPGSAKLRCGAVAGWHASPGAGLWRGRFAGFWARAGSGARGPGAVRAGAGPGRAWARRGGPAPVGRGGVGASLRAVVSGCALGLCCRAVLSGCAVGLC